MSMYSSSNFQPGDCIRFVCFLLILSTVATACSSLKPYRLSENTGPIATIEDKEPRIGSFDFHQIMSIDRKRIDSESRGINSNRLDEGFDAPGDPEDWIPLRAGLRKLEVQVCKYSPGVLDLLSFSGWYCGHAVLPLVAESGVHYRLRGSMNKQGNYAEIWIEDARSQKTVVDIIRVPIEDW